MATNPDDQTLLLGGFFGSTKRSGAWQVPERVLLKRRFGSAELDLTEAIFAGTEISFEIDMIGGSIELRVPEDVHVTSSMLTNFASYQDHRKTNPHPAERTLTISGRATLGSVEVRGPKKSRRSRG
jgi:predicted membrane protein